MIQKEENLTVGASCPPGAGHDAAPGPPLKPARTGGDPPTSGFRKFARGCLPPPTGGEPPNGNPTPRRARSSTEVDQRCVTRGGNVDRVRLQRIRARYRAVRSGGTVHSLGARLGGGGCREVAPCSVGACTTDGKRWDEFRRMASEEGDDGFLVSVCVCVCCRAACQSFS